MSGRRASGRPKVIKTVKPGRPRKQFQEYEKEANACEVVYLAEVQASRALSSVHANEWMEAMASEVKSIIDKNTWDLIDALTLPLETYWKLLVIVHSDSMPDRPTMKSEDHRKQNDT